MTAFSINSLALSLWPASTFDFQGDANNSFTHIPKSYSSVFHSEYSSNQDRGSTHDNMSRFSGVEATDSQALEGVTDTSIPSDPYVDPSVRDIAQAMMTIMDDTTPLTTLFPFHGETSGKLAELINETPLSDMDDLAGELAAHSATGLGGEQTALGQTFNLLAGPDFDVVKTRFYEAGVVRDVDILFPFHKGVENQLLRGAHVASKIVQDPASFAGDVLEVGAYFFVNMGVNPAYGYNATVKMIDPEGAAAARSSFETFVSDSWSDIKGGVGAGNNEPYTNLGLGNVYAGELAFKLLLTDRVSRVGGASVLKSLR